MTGPSWVLLRARDKFGLGYGLMLSKENEYDEYIGKEKKEFTCTPSYQAQIIPIRC